MKSQRYQRREPATVRTGGVSSGAIKRIDDLSRSARTSWIGLLGFLAFVGVTLLGVQDADFFIPSRQTKLPLVGVAIPTASFFIFAPILGAALYIYLHIHLTKLWQALGAARHAHGGAAVQAKVFPWLVNDLALTFPGPNAALRGPLTWISSAVTVLLVWIAAPAVLLGFWWRSFPAHELWTTTSIAICALAALYVGFTSCRIFMDATVRARTESAFLRKVFKRITLTLAIGAAIFMFTFGEARTQSELPGMRSILTYFSKQKLFRTSNHQLAKAELSRVAFSNRPASWRSPQMARSRYRNEWCRAVNLSSDICGPAPQIGLAPSPGLMERRAAWCDGMLAGPASSSEACVKHFEELNDAFERDWSEERWNDIAALNPISLARADLRGARLYGAFMVGTDLRGADLQDSDLRFAQLEGAAVEYASLERACLRNANLTNVKARVGLFLKGANLEGAVFDGSNLVGANFTSAFLTRTSFRNVVFRASTFFLSDIANASFQGTIFSTTDLQNVGFFNSSFEAANLSKATVNRTRFQAVTFDTRTVLKDFREFEGNSLCAVDLTQLDPDNIDWEAVLSGSFGDASVKLPSGKPWPEHWASSTLNNDDFYEMHRAWLVQSEIAKIEIDMDLVYLSREAAWAGWCASQDGEDEPQRLR